MVWPLAPRWPRSRSVKNACSVGASAVTAVLRGRGGRRPVPSAPGPRSGTSYSDVGITGITPILGLFRYLLPRAHDGPATWDDALSRLSPAGIIRCVSCADGDLFCGV